MVDIIDLKNYDYFLQKFFKVVLFFAIVYFIIKHELPHELSNGSFRLPLQITLIFIFIEMNYPSVKLCQK